MSNRKNFWVKSIKREDKFCHFMSKFSPAKLKILSQRDIFKFSICFQARLTLLVCMTATAGYAMAPGVFSFHTAVCATIGTAMASAAANTINQILEVPFDSQMNRTKNR